jgi:NitT/TauT family transport system ATP-binding protein
MARIGVRGVSMAFRAGDASRPVLQDVTLHVDDGEFLSIVGPSGCGKTTLLNLVAGLLRPDQGVIEVDGRPVSGPGPDRAVVFQEAALLPWRTVLRNVELGLEMQHRYAQSDVRERALHFVRLVGLAEFAAHYPHQLSGGMRQRVNLARALVAEPEVLLMDEPFASLDAYTREAMGDELQRIWQETRKTVVFVTHSADEAILLSDRIIAMGTAPGRILEELKVELPRPRSVEVRTLPRFTELGVEIRALLARARGPTVAADVRARPVV